MKAVRQFKTLAAAAVAMIILMTAAGAGAQNTYFTGNGGKGIRLAVLEPAGKGLADGDKWMLSLVQGSIYTDFNKYSGMTLIDKQNIEKIYDEWEQSMSGNYSDADRVKIGNLTNASHILSGTVIKTPNAFMLELSITDLQSGERKASYSQSVSAAALENHSAIKGASAELLRQLGVNLTGAAVGELKQAANIARIQAEEALARGITAKRQGTEVAALSYFFQAAALDPSLAEAVNRSSVLAANVSSGNIGEDARNDIVWRKSWVKRLEETEQYIDHLNKTVSMPYTLFYSDEIIEGDINYQTETMSLSIKTILYGNGSIRVWAQSVQKALQTVYDGLEATGRKDTWGLSWPYNRVTKLNAFGRQGRTFNIVAELVNSRNTVIGRQEFQVGGYWEYNNYSGRMGVSVSSDGRKYVRFTNVKANDITDKLTIQFASVNGIDADTAAKNGILQIRPMPKSEFDANDRFKFAFGEISGYNGAGGNLVIPNAVWNDRVISIAGDAFSGKLLTGVTISANITLGQNAIGNGFEWFYQNEGNKAGAYTYQGNTWITRDGVTAIGTIEMVFVQGGTFFMGGGGVYEDDARPEHKVTLNSFQIGKYEITQRLWKAVMADNPSKFKGDNLPVTNVSWNDVQGFIQKLNAITGKRYRLPTEAEWEYAARGGGSSKKNKYSGSNTISDIAWYGGNSGSQTHQIGTKQPNELGIYDMSGNVLEWVNDWYGNYSHSTTTQSVKNVKAGPFQVGVYEYDNSVHNPKGPGSGSRRVVRGCGFNNNDKDCRVFFRSYSTVPGNRHNDLGFRLALDP